MRGEILGVFAKIDHIIFNFLLSFFCEKAIYIHKQHFVAGQICFIYSISVSMGRKHTFIPIKFFQSNCWSRYIEINIGTVRIQIAI